MVTSEAKYAMYLRKSRSDLELEAMGEGETLARHKKMLEALAQKHDISANQITVYQELVSGESIDERPEMQRLLSDVYAKKYAGVLVVEIERLARGNTRDQGEVADAFQISNTKIITPAKVYDPNNEFDQEYFEFGLFMSRREYKTIRRRMEAGKQQSIMEGNYLLPQRIFGYDIERRSKKDRVLVPNEDEAKIVQMIFDWYSEDRKSVDWIAKQLTLMGIRTMQNKAEWGRETIRDMLQNMHYIGKITWKQHTITKVFDEATGKLVKKRIRNNEPEVYEGKHDGIISVEQFEKVQSIFKSRAPINTKAEMVNPLSTLLVCKHCGKTLALITYSKYSKRDNRFQHRASFHCKVKSASAENVYNSIIEGLKAYIADFEMKLESRNDQTELIKHQEVIKTMEAELKKQENRKRKLLDSWESDDGIYTKDEFIERKVMYTQSIDQIKKQIQELKASAPEPVDYKAQIVNLHAMIDCINNPDISAKEKNEFLKEFIDRIEYDSIDLGAQKGAKLLLDIHLK